MADPDETPTPPKSPSYSPKKDEDEDILVENSSERHFCPHLEDHLKSGGQRLLFWTASLAKIITVEFLRKLIPDQKVFDNVSNTALQEIAHAYTMKSGLDRACIFCYEEKPPQYVGVTILETETIDGIRVVGTASTKIYSCQQFIDGFMDGSIKADSIYTMYGDCSFACCLEHAKLGSYTAKQKDVEEGKEFTTSKKPNDLSPFQKYVRYVNKEWSDINEPTVWLGKEVRRNNELEVENQVLRKVVHELQHKSPKSAKKKRMEDPLPIQEDQPTGIKYPHVWDPTGFTTTKRCAVCTGWFLPKNFDTTECPGQMNETEKYLASTGMLIKWGRMK